MGLDVNASTYGDVILQEPEVAKNWAQSRLAATEADQAALEMPTNVEAAKTKLGQDQTTLAGSKLALENAQVEQPVTQMRAYEARLAQGAGAIKPGDPKAADRWSSFIQKEIADGNPLAEQWQDYSPSAMSNLATAYSEASPTAQQSALSASPFQSALGSPTGVGPGQTPQGGAPSAPMDWEAQFAGKPLPELQQNLVHLDTIKAGLQAVASSPNPAAEWDRQMKINGVPNPPPYSPQAFNAIAQQVVPMDDALRAHMTRATMGVPTPQVAPKIENVGGNLVSTNPANPAAGATSLYVPDKWTPMPYSIGPGGGSQIFDKSTGASKELPGSIQVRGGGSAAAIRQQVGEAQGLTGQALLDYVANPKPANPQQQAIAELRAATAMRDVDVNAASLSGKPLTSVPPLSVYEAQVHDAMGIAPAGAPGAAGTAAIPPAPKGWADAQWAKAQQYKGNVGQPRGTTANPVAPLNKAQYDGLKPGTWYIDPNGHVFQKTR